MTHRTTANLENGSLACESPASPSHATSKIFDIRAWAKPRSPRITPDTQSITPTVSAWEEAQTHENVQQRHAEELFSGGELQQSEAKQARRNGKPPALEEDLLSAAELRLKRAVSAVEQAERTRREKCGMLALCTGMHRHAE